MELRINCVRINRSRPVLVRFFAENWMKMKKIGPRGHVPSVPLHPPVPSLLLLAPFAEFGELIEKQKNSIGDYILHLLLRLQISL